MARPSAIPTVQIDNDHVRVTQWLFPPGAETGWHRHEMNYVVVPMTTGPLLLETATGETNSKLVTGASYYRDGGAEHNVVNPGETDFIFIEIEFKHTARKG
jgi:quercetin dioxygenase-like cupin family protein